MGKYADISNLHANALAQSGALYRNTQNVKQADRAKFTDSINNALSEAAAYKRQELQNSGLLDRQTVSDENAYKRLGYQADIATKQFEREQKATSNIIKSAKDVYSMWTDSEGQVDFDSANAMLQAVYGEAANPIIASLSRAGKGKDTTPGPSSVTWPTVQENVKGNLSNDEWQPIQYANEPSTPEEAEAASRPNYFNMAGVDAFMNKNKSIAAKNNAQANQANAEANAFNALNGFGGDSGQAVPTTPEEAQALAEGNVLKTMKPFKDEYAHLQFSNEGDEQSLAPLSMGGGEPLKNRGPSGEVVPYKPNAKLQAMLDQRKRQKLTAIAYKDKVALRDLEKEPTELVKGLDQLSTFRDKATAMISNLDASDRKTNLKADTIKWLSDVADSAALKEISWREQFKNLSPGEQTQATADLFSMLGDLAAYARSKGEKGVISDRDITRYAQLLIESGSSQALNREKMLNLVNDMSSKAANRFSELGMNTFANEYIEATNKVRPQLGYQYWDYDDGVGYTESNPLIHNVKGGGSKLDALNASMDGF